MGATGPAQRAAIERPLTYEELLQLEERGVVDCLHCLYLSYDGIKPRRCALLLTLFIIDRTPAHAAADAEHVRISGGPITVSPDRD